MTSLRVHITALGSRGDGIGKADGKKIYVPHTLPGEDVLCASVAARFGGVAARLQEIVSPSPDRQPPPCPHFGHCGGCAAQHMKPPAYRAWKLEKTAEILRRGGLDIPITPLFFAEPGSRRRASLRLVKREGKAVVGFLEAFSNRVVEVSTCPLLLPELNRALAAMGEFAGDILKSCGPCALTLTHTKSGVDVAIAPEKPSRRRPTLAQPAAPLCRVSLKVENGWHPLWEHTPALVRFRKNAVPLPPGGFLQAVAAAEEILRKEALGFLAGCGQIGDLFCGCGTFGLPLAESGTTVVAADGDEASVRALTEAARELPLTTQVRDLFKNPLSAGELDGFDGAILDPPRAGAAAQTARLAQGGVPRVVMISCDATSFSRDAALLISGGYRCEKVGLVDQFLWSPHVELVGCFGKNTS